MEEEKIIVDYSNQTSSFFMLILGGQITLMSAFFKDSDSVEIGLIAILFMLLASMIARTIGESTIRRLIEKPNFNNKVANFILYKAFSTSIESI